MRWWPLLPELLCAATALALLAPALGLGPRRLAARPRLLLLGGAAASLAAALASLGAAEDFLFAAYRIDGLSQAAKACVGGGLVLAALAGGADDQRPATGLFLALAALALEVAVSAMDLIAVVAALATAFLSLVFTATLAPDRGGMRRPLRRLVGCTLAPLGVLSAGAALLAASAGEDSLSRLAEAAPAALARTGMVAGSLLTLGGLMYLLGAVPVFAPVPLLMRDAWPPLAVFSCTATWCGVALVLARAAAALGGPLGTSALWPLAVLAVTAALLGALRARRRDDVRCAVSHSLTAQGGLLAVGLLALTGYGRSSALGAALVVAAAHAAAQLVLARQPYAGAALSLDELRGLWWTDRAGSLALAAAALALAGLPPTAGLVARWRLLDGAWEEGWRWPVAGALAAGLVLAWLAAHLLAVLPARPAAASRREPGPGPFIAVGLAAALVLAGLFPGPLYRAAEAGAALLP
jgi:NADH:ubiquinone oxidoreductase subunit 2 (subunit N)